MNFSTSLLKFIKKNQFECKICDILWNKAIPTDFCDYVAIRNELLTYMPHGREQKFNDSGKWVRDGRQEIKPAKLMRKIISVEYIELGEIKDADFEKFANLLKSFVGVNGCDEHEGKITLKIVNGEFIRHYYTTELNGSKLNGSNLIGSCMQNKDSNFFDMYVKNPNVCSLAILVDGENDLIGRALIWKDRSDKKMLDTIYSDSKHFDIFKNFAIDNGMYYKSSQSCHFNTFDMLGNSNIGNIVFNVNLNYNKMDFYPYMDTLQYLCDGTLTNDQPEDCDYMELRSTQGDYEQHTSNPVVYDEHDGNDIYEDDAIYLDYRTNSGDRFSGYTHVDNTVSAYINGRNRQETRLDDHCIYIDGEYFENGHDDIVYSEYLGDNVHIDNVVYSDFSEDYIPSDMAVFCEETSEYFLQGDYENIKSTHE